MAETNSVPLWWILVFLLLALGAGVLAVVGTGGDLVQAPSGVVAPF